MVIQGVSHAVGGPLEPGTFVGVEVLSGDGGNQPRQLVVHDGPLVRWKAPRELFEQLEKPVDHLRIGGAVTAGLTDGELDEIGEHGPVQDDPRPRVVVAQNEWPEVMVSDLAEEG